MAVSAIASAPSQAASSSELSASHKHNGRRVQSLTDIDAQGSSLASKPSSTGQIGSKVDITV